MKKTTLKNFTSLITMLALLTSLGLLLAIGASAEVPVQATWGTDANNLTVGSGTLQEALDAAKTDPTVTYVKVMDDVDLGADYLRAEGGTFTLDLNGKTIVGDIGSLSLYNNVDLTIVDSSADANGKLEAINDGTTTIEFASNANGAKLTLQSGTLAAGSNALIYANNVSASITIKGGSLITHCRHHIIWNSTGILDFSEHPDPTGISIIQSTGDILSLPNDHIRLPESYCFYENDTIVTTLEYNMPYTIGLTRHRVTVAETTNGTVEISPVGAQFLPNTEIALQVTPNAGYLVDQITVIGAALNTESNTFVVGDQDVTVQVTFKPYQADWGTSADSLPNKGTLQEALNAAASDPTVTYVKVVRSVDLGNNTLPANGGNFTLDLNGHTVTSFDRVFLLKGSLQLTVTDTSAEKTGRIEATQPSSIAISVEDELPKKLTVAGGTIKGANYAVSADFNGNGSALDLTITGGVLQYVSTAHINWQSTGTLRLSAPPAATLLKIMYRSGNQFVLPTGYAFHNAEGQRISAPTTSGVYSIEQIKHELRFDLGNGVDESSSLFPDAASVPAETKISFTLSLHNHYGVASVTVNNGAITPNFDAPTGTYSFTMPNGPATVTVKTKHIAYTWGPSADEMLFAGDFHDLVAAINASSTTVYAKLLDNSDVSLPTESLTVKGKAIIDLNGHTVWISSETGHRIILDNGAAITFFANIATDAPLYFGETEASGSFELKTGSTLTFDGAVAYSLKVYYNGGRLDISNAHLSSSVELFNVTEKEVAVSDFVTPGNRFRPIDWDALSLNGYATTPPTYQTIPVWDGSHYGHSLNAVFSVSFHFGEGNGSMPSVEVPYYSYVTIPTAENASHPDGLTLIGWSYDSKNYTLHTAKEYYHYMLTDVTFVAKWGAPIYVGDVEMTDGDYLASGTNEVTQKRPIAGGYAYYENGVLTLKDYQFTGEGFVFDHDGYYNEDYTALIYSARDLIIELVGSSTLKGNGSYESNGVYSIGAITVRGSGSLWIEGVGDALNAKDLTVEGGTVVAAAYDDAIVVGTLNLFGGVLTTLSDYGIRADSVLITGGELHLLPMDESDNNVTLSAKSFTMEDGLLIIKGYYGISSNYVTVNGGTIEIEAEDDAIENWYNSYSDAIPSDAFLKVTGGRLTLYAWDDSIDFSGAITISGGVLDLESDYGIYVSEGSLTVSGGELIIYSYYEGIRLENSTLTVSDGIVSIQSEHGVKVYDSTVTISGGILDVDGFTSAIYASASTVTVSGGRLLLLGAIDLEEDSLLKLGGKSTLLMVEALPTGAQLIVNTEELKQIFTNSTLTYFEGVSITHTWSDWIRTDSTHQRVCTDPNCPTKFLEENFIIPAEILYSVFEASGYGAHTIPDGESLCTVCGYSATEPPVTPPADTVLLVGDHCLKLGDYLTNDGQIVTEKPATGGYLHVSQDTSGTLPFSTILLHDFVFEASAQALLTPHPAMLWTIKLEGTNVLTAHVDPSPDPSLPENGVGIFLNNTLLLIYGDGNLTINAEVGISAANATIHIQDGATVTINAGDDGIYADTTDLAFGSKTSVTIHAVDDGVDLSDGVLIVQDNTHFTVTVDDEALNLSYVKFYAEGATIDLIAGDDGIDGDYCTFIWEDSTITVYADDCGITMGFYEEDTDGTPELYAYNVTLKIVSEDDAFEAYSDYDHAFELSKCTVELTSEDLGFDLYGVSVEFDESKITITAAGNTVEYADLAMYNTVFNVQANEAALELIDAYLSIGYGSEATIVSHSDAIVGDYSEIYVDDSKLSIQAPRYGIYGDMDLFVYGSTVIEIRATIAVMCAEFFPDSTTPFLLNAEPYYDSENNATTFYDENWDVASYVTIRSTTAVFNEMTEAIDVLDQIISEGGEIEIITNAIADVNSLLDTLTNTEGEGRLDLIEQANQSINNALAALEQRLNKAQADLNSAITNGDAALDQKITDLNTAMNNVQAAYAAADTALSNELNAKLSTAQATLNAAIKAVDTKVEQIKNDLTKAQNDLNQAITNGDNALDEKIKALTKALEQAEAAYANADGTLKAELQGKITTAEATLDAAIKAVDTKVEQIKNDLTKAQNDLNLAITNGDNALDEKIEALTKALEQAEAAYANADGTLKAELQGKITTAEATLNAALTSVEQQLTSVKTELNQSISESDEALRAELEALRSELTEKAETPTAMQTTTLIIAIVSVVCNAGLITTLILLDRQKKLLSPVFKSLFSRKTGSSGGSSEGNE